MKKYFEVIGFVTLAIFSFYFTSKTSTVIKNTDDIKQINEDTYNYINKIYNDFEIKPNYINFHIKDDEDKIYKNDKFELVINKFLSIAYLKKERKRKPEDNNKKTHKRGMTGL